MTVKNASGTAELPHRPDAGQYRLTQSFTVLALCWTLFIAVLCFWQYRQAKTSAMEMARTDALSTYNKDIAYRRWATRHGGVYVPITPETPPNAFLAHIPERDITTPSGKKLTLINPAYMTRQVHELSTEQYGTRGHITSLKPLRPENAPDPWEAKALQAFEAGVKEESSLEMIGNELYMRFIRPIVTEAGCLKCHAHQGYKVGDIRGGISVSVPWKPYHDVIRGHLHNVYLGFGGVWLIGIVGLWLAQRRIQHSVFMQEQADKKLRMNEERMYLAMKATDLGLYDLNLKTGEAVVNAGYALMLGYDPGEFHETNAAWIERLHPDDKKPVAEIYQSYIKGLLPEYIAEFRQRTKDGVWKWIRSQGKIVEWDTDGNPVRMLGTHSDISKAKAADEALRESEALYRELFEAESDAIVLVDNETGRIIEANSAAAALYGFNRAELLSKKNTDLSAEPEDTQRITQRVAVAPGEIVKIPQRLHRNKDGVVFPVEITGRFFTLFGRSVHIAAIRDITERKQTENKLAHMHDLMQYIISHAQTAIAVHDRDMKYIYVSDQYLKQYGVKEKDIIGEHHYDVFPNLPQKWREVHQRVLAGATEGQDEDPYVRENGTVDWTRWQCLPWYEADGLIGGLIVYTEVITDRVKVKEQLLGNLKEKEVMLKEIHHRVKNNMQVIHSLLSLQSKAIADPTIRNMFVESQNRIQSMALIHEKLYQSRDMAHIDFREYLKSLVQNLASTFKRLDVQISVEMDQIALDVNIGIPCGLIVNELVSNCLKHAFPEGRPGTITLGIKRNSDDNNVLTVADDGVGLPETVDFRNTSSLGLQLVNVLTGQINGTIEMVADGGTKFSITFPGGGGGKGK